VGRDSVVGVEARYWLDGPGIESRCGEIFHTHPDRPPGSTQPLIQWVLLVILGVKRQGRDVNHPPPSSTKHKERVELYLYSPSVPSRQVIG
jgi:hypothetical protein